MLLLGKFVVNGDKGLEGRIRNNGAKNAALPILAAAVLSDGEVILHDCPQIVDVQNMLLILESIGCGVKREEKHIILEPRDIDMWRIPDKYVRKIRSSIVFLGALIGRMGRAEAAYPGGCEIGQRPIDLHLDAFKKLGISVDDSHGYINCTAPHIKGAEIHLEYPSVGATENIMLAASKGKGHTVIYNAAKEPEVVDLQNFINAMGGKIWGAGGNTIYIEGVDRLQSVEYTIIPDRIVAGTYLMACAASGGDVFVDNVNIEHIFPILSKLQEAGCVVSLEKDGVRILVENRLKAISHTITLPYPGFPSDMQSPLMALLTTAEGTSIITETIFESRYKHVPELIRMGARIYIDGMTAVVQGVDMLQGVEVCATDLRGGAALLIAALGAQGITVIDNVTHVDRGYECLDEKLNSIGADIKRIE